MVEPQPDHAWVDPEEYPFRSRYLEVAGGRMHYVDEGSGPPILMVHGTPTWSFLYRHLIGHLSRRFRVVAADHIGFGLSDKPKHWSYRPADHAKNIERLVVGLGLEDVTLVVHDFGGPIGLSYAIERPSNVRAMILFNTWMWSLAGTSAERVGRVMSSRLGRFLYLRLNFSPRVILKAAYGDRRKLTPHIHRHYLRAFPAPCDRLGAWTFARELVGSSDWYEELWERRARIADKPALLMWGMRDPAFPPAALDRWESALTNANVVRLEEAGHLVMEEAPAFVASEVNRFLTPAPDPTFS